MLDVGADVDDRPSLLGVMPFSPAFFLNLSLEYFDIFAAFYARVSLFICVRYPFMLLTLYY